MCNLDDERWISCFFWVVVAGVPCLCPHTAGIDSSTMFFTVLKISWVFSFCALIAQVLKLNGILPLVALLRSPSIEVNQTASAALRSLSFKNTDNKEEIYRCSGVTEAVALLRDTDSAEIQKQLTGMNLP